MFWANIFNSLLVIIESTLTCVDINFFEHSRINCLFDTQGARNKLWIQSSEKTIWFHLGQNFIETGKKQERKWGAGINYMFENEVVYWILEH